MKFGKISLIINEDHAINYGDIIQDFACEHLYETMGIAQDEIVEIPVGESYLYDGEYVVVPVYNAMLDGYYTGRHVFSKKIIPVFLGFTTDLAVLPEDMLDYLKKYQPIGCRDEYTFRLLRQHHIEAYIGGCISSTLPKRSAGPKYQKVFLTDVPEKVISFIPPDFLKNAEFIKQAGDFAYTDKKERRSAVRKAASEFYRRYCDEAALVVTSRLHTAFPCLAMGIPLIIVRDEMWKTFTSIDAFARIYLDGDYQNIDWNPKPVEYDRIKQAILEVYQTRLLDTYNKYVNIYQVSEFFENRNKTQSKNDFQYRLNEMVSCMKEYLSEKFDYIIWGAGVRGHMACARIKQEFPDADFLFYVDSFKKGKLDGQEIRATDDLQYSNKAYVVICNNTGEEQAIQKMKELGKEKGRDFFSTNK